MLRIKLKLFLSATIFAALTHHAGIKAAIICVALLNRLNGDQVTFITFNLCHLSNPQFSRWWHQKKWWTNGKNDPKFSFHASFGNDWHCRVNWARFTVDRSKAHVVSSLFNRKAKRTNKQLACYQKSRCIISSAIVISENIPFVRLYSLKLSIIIIIQVTTKT